MTRKPTREAVVAEMSEFLNKEMHNAAKAAIAQNQWRDMLPDILQTAKTLVAALRRALQDGQKHLPDPSVHDDTLVVRFNDRKVTRIYGDEITEHGAVLKISIDHNGDLLAQRWPYSVDYPDSSLKSDVVAHNVHDSDVPVLRSVLRFLEWATVESGQGRQRAKFMSAAEQYEQAK